MKTGFIGTYVLTSDQIQLDGAAGGLGQLPKTGQVRSGHGMGTPCVWMGRILL